MLLKRALQPVGGLFLGLSLFSCTPFTSHGEVKQTMLEGTTSGSKTSTQQENAYTWQLVKVPATVRGGVMIPEHEEWVLVKAGDGPTMPFMIPPTSKEHGKEVREEKPVVKKESSPHVPVEALPLLAANAAAPGPQPSGQVEPPYSGQVVAEARQVITKSKATHKGPGPLGEVFPTAIFNGKTKEVVLDREISFYDLDELAQKLRDNLNIFVEVSDNSLTFSDVKEISYETGFFTEELAKDVKGLLNNPDSRAAVMLDFRAAPVKEVLTELSRQAGVNIVYADMEDDAAITVYYKGDNVKEALNSIMSSGNLSYIQEGNTFTVSQYETKTFDVSVLYESSFDMGNQSTGAVGQVPQNQPTATGTGSSSGLSFGQSQVYIKGNGFEGFLTKVIERIKPLLSQKGRITFLPSGVLFVKDTPRVIKEVEDLLDVDNSKHKEISLKLSLIRIDYNNENQAGVDWQSVIKGISGFAGIKEIAIGGNFSPLVQNSNVGAITFKNGSSNVQDFVKLLSSYGDVHIVHNWQTKALSGTLLPFELTQTVWYSQGSTVQVINNQTITTPIISNSQVGVKIRLTPTVFKEDKFLINTFIELSSIVGSQSVAGLEFPNIETNMVSIPIAMSARETATISGFKITTESKSNIGLPLLNNIPILRTLFGYTDKVNKTSELIVVMSLGD